MRIYLCDPTLNTTCKKDMCQKGCKMTPNKEYAKILIDPKDGMKMVVYKDIDEKFNESVGIKQY